MDLLGLANYAVFMAILIGIYALLALGLNIQWGFTGLFNAGIAGFFAIGAYTSAILTSLPASGRLGGYELPLLVGWAASMAAAAAIAWPIGKICLRFRSDYLAIATIGIAEIIRLVIRTEGWLTGGVRGVTGIPRPFGELDYMPSQIAYLAIVATLAYLVPLPLLLLPAKLLSPVLVVQNQVNRLTAFNILTSLALATGVIAACLAWRTPDAMILVRVGVGVGAAVRYCSGTTPTDGGATTGSGSAVHPDRTTTAATAATTRRGAFIPPR